MRKHRKMVQAKMKHGCSWNWSFDKFVRAVVGAMTPLNEALQRVYGEAMEKRINEQQTQRP